MESTTDGSIDSKNITFNELPNEIIDKVFRLLSFETIAKNRIVSILMIAFIWL